MTFQFKRSVESLAGPKGSGPSTTFSTFHIFRAMELLAIEPMGRNRLAEKLRVGKGAIRTIISHLKDAGLVATSKKGGTLTSKGLNLWKRIVEVFPKRVEIEKTALTTSQYNYAFLVKNKGHRVRSGIDQRDAAIMGGARRALVIVVKNERLIIESISTDLKKDYPEAANNLISDLKPENNDVIIIAGADNPSKAMHGAFAASWALLGNN